MAVLVVSSAPAALAHWQFAHWQFDLRQFTRDAFPYRFLGDKGDAANVDNAHNLPLRRPFDQFVEVGLGIRCADVVHQRSIGLHVTRSGSTYSEVNLNSR
jgi:hypothetical protein